MNIFCSTDTSKEFFDFTKEATFLHVGYFYKQFADAKIAQIFDGIRIRDSYIYCQERPMFKNGGFDYNLEKSPLQKECFDLIAAMLAEDDEEWDYMEIMSEWIEAFMSGDVPDTYDFNLSSSVSDAEFTRIIIGMCFSLLDEQYGDCGDYKSLIEEAVEKFVDQL